MGFDQNPNLNLVYFTSFHRCCMFFENATVLVSHILENAHNRNYNVRATCSNSVSDGLCGHTHNFSFFTQRHFNCVYLPKKRKQGIPGCLCHTQTYKHWDLKQSFVCMLLTPVLLVFTALLCHPEWTKGPHSHIIGLLSLKGANIIYILCGAARRSSERSGTSASDHTLATANQNLYLLMDPFLEITHSKPSLGLKTLVTRS